MNDNCILGLLNDDSKNEYNISNKLTSHACSRSNRMKLISEWSRPLCYFEVYRRKSQSRQIHCLLEDASILVFNKNTKKIITFIIPCPKSFEKYVSSLVRCIDELKLDKLYRYTKLNKKSQACKVDNQFKLTEEEVSNYLLKKLQIHTR